MNVLDTYRPVGAVELWSVEFHLVAKLDETHSQPHSLFIKHI